MTDEAFVRAVVERPGDDTPRLVYADWLDDHDQPARAAYLRAEVAAVRGRDGADLRETAVGLDAVWVARVSRPPAGVCCVGVRFEEAGPRLTDDSFAEVKRWRRVRLPDDYTAFLLNHNGGMPMFPEARPAEVASLRVSVNRFFPLHPDDDVRTAGTLHYEVHRYWNNRLPRLMETKPPDWEAGDEAWYHEFIPVAEADWGGASIMLGVHGPWRGRLQLIRWDWTVGSFMPEESDQLGGSFAGLLACIAPLIE